MGLIALIGSGVVQAEEQVPAGLRGAVDGTGQSASGSCTGLAGNVSAPATASGLNIDKTVSLAMASASPEANAIGWYCCAVTVTFDGSDALSGIADCDNDVILSEDGVGMSASGPYEEGPESSARRPPSQIS